MKLPQNPLISMKDIIIINIKYDSNKLLLVELPRVFHPEDPLQLGQPGDPLESLQGPEPAKSPVRLQAERLLADAVLPGPRAAVLVGLRQPRLLLQQVPPPLPGARRLVPRPQGQDARPQERRFLREQHEELKVHDAHPQLHPPRLLQGDPQVPTLRPAPLRRPLSLRQTGRHGGVSGPRARGSPGKEEVVPARRGHRQPDLQASHDRLRLQPRPLGVGPAAEDLGAREGRAPAV